MTLLRISACWLLVALFASLTTAEEANSLPQTGSDIGAEVPTFFVRHVTGLRPTVATCFVCRYGARPVVMICSRKVDRQVEKLVREIDQVVDGHRGVGLRGFGIFMAERPNDVQPTLMTLARKDRVSMPLTIPVEHINGPTELALPEAPTTVLFYNHRTVIGHYTYQTGDLGEAQISHLVEAAKLLAGGAQELPKQPVEAAE